MIWSISNLLLTKFSMQKLSPRALGLSIGFVFSASYVICALAYALAPEVTLSFFNTLFHGLDLKEIAVGLTWGGTISGLIITFVLGLLGGGVVAHCYNHCLPKE